VVSTFGGAGNFLKVVWRWH